MEIFIVFDNERNVVLVVNSQGKANTVIKGEDWTIERYQVH